MNEDLKNAAGFSEDAIRRFLLGQLSGTEQLTFEEALMADDSLAERVRLAECELSDDYALERLPRADRQAFEQKFLLSADRERKLRVSSALRDRFAVETVKVKRAVPGRLTFRRSWLGYAVGFAVLLVLLGAGWWLIRKPHGGENSIVRERPTPARPSPADQKEAAHPPNSISPEHREPTPLPSAHEPVDSPAPAPTVVVTLTPNSFSNIFERPQSNEGLVRLTLVLAANAGEYQAEVITKAGETIFSQSSIKPIRNAFTSNINLDIPLSSLKPGDHEVKVTRMNEPHEWIYYFTVR